MSLKDDIKKYQQKAQANYKQEQENLRITNSPWVPTTVEGLDDLLNGGLLFPYFDKDNSSDTGPGLVLLIKGQPGTGKSTLAAKILLGVVSCNKGSKDIDRSPCYQETLGRYDNYFWKDKTIKDVAQCAHPSYEEYFKYIQEVMSLSNENSYKGAHIFNCEQNATEYKALLRRLSKQTLKLRKSKEQKSGEEVDATLLLQESIKQIETEFCYETLFEFSKTPKHNKSQRNYSEWLNDLVVKITTMSQSKNEPQTLPPFTCTEHSKSCSANWKCEKKEEYIEKENIRDSKKRVILIDGFNSFPSDSRRQIDAQYIIRNLRKAALLSIIVYEDEKDHHENMDYLADIIIKLDGKEYQGHPSYYMNKLLIQKSRFQSCIRGWHQYKITDKGLVVFPSLSYNVGKYETINDYLDYAKNDSVEDSFQKQDQHQKICQNSEQMHYPPCSYCRYQDDVTGIHELLKLGEIIGGSNVDPEYLLHKIAGKYIKRGTTTAILGPKHTFKFYLAFDFLRVGSLTDEHGLLIMLQDKEPELLHEKNRLCNWTCGKLYDKDKSKECYKNIHNFLLRPGMITPAEFMHHLDILLKTHASEGRAITRLAFCDLVQMENRFPFFAEDDMLIPSIMTYLKYKWGITSVFIGAANGKIGKKIAELAHNVIYCWMDRKGKESKNLDYYAFYHNHAERNTGEKDENFHFIEWSLDTNLMKPCDGVTKDCWDFTDSKPQGCKEVITDEKDFEFAPEMQKLIWEIHGLSER